MVDENARAKAEALLAEAESFLSSGDLRMARRALDEARDKLGSTKSEQLKTLTNRLTGRERLAGPIAALEAARDREDWIAARDHARRAADRATGPEAEVLRRVADECAANVRAEWRLGEIGVDGANGILTANVDKSDAPRPHLTDDGSTLLLFDVHGHWVFLREVDVETGRSKRLAWLRAPVRVGELAPIQVHGDTIWIAAEAGHLLEIRRRPLDVVRRISLRPFMLPDRRINDAWVVPPGHFVWGELKDVDEEQAIAVIDTEEWRVCRRPPADHFVAVPGADPPRILGVRVLEEAAELYDPSGESVDWTAPEDARVRSLAAHPTDRGWIALAGVPGREEEVVNPLALIEMREGQPPSAPVVLEGTNEDCVATLATSPTLRRAFVLTDAGEAMQLFAFRAGLEGLEQTWVVEVPYETALVQDGRGHHVVLVIGTRRGVEVARLDRSPPVFDAAPEGEMPLPHATFWLGAPDGEERALTEEAWRKPKGGISRWAERMRKQRRRNPAGLAVLVHALCKSGRPDLAVSTADYALDRYPEDPRLLLARAHVDVVRERFADAAEILARVEEGALQDEDRRRLRILRGCTSLRLGDPMNAVAHLERAGSFESFGERPRLDLEVARALLAPLDAEPAAASAVVEIVRACRRADTCFAEQDVEAARRALDVPIVHATKELQSAARLTETYLEAPDDTPKERFRKAAVLARLVETERKYWENLPGLGWDADRIAGVEERSRRWLEAFERRLLEAVGPIPGWGDAEPPPPVPSPPAPEHASTGPRAPETHTLPPVGHEVIRRLFPELNAAVLETVRYVRDLPEWDETQTLGEALIDLAPARRFLSACREGPGSTAVLPSGARLDVDAICRHLDYCVNAELHRRKLFFADASLAWMLQQTNLDIEGRALRMPFPCFGLVFTDDPTLELVDGLLEEELGTPVDRGQSRALTAYVIRATAPEGRTAVRLRFVIDAQDEAPPVVVTRRLSYRDDDDLDRILGPSSKQTRHLLHLVVNAILYCTSAGVSWPIARSRTHQIRSQGRGRGKAKRARVARRIEEMKARVSDEEVFYLPGRIPISQLRALQQTERGHEGTQLMARFMVRGHWRRAAHGWRDQRLRWIEPYWKGPDLAVIVEKEYKLKI